MKSCGSIVPALAVFVAALDPFAFFQPTLRFTATELASLGRGAAVARSADAPRGNVTIVAAVPVAIDGDRLVSWIRDIAALKQSPVVRQIGRFSSVPTVADVGGLTLDADDLRDVARCRPGDCGLKLTDAEVARLQGAARSVRSGTAQTDAVQQAFREVVVARAAAYLQAGRSGPPPPVFLTEHWPAVAQGLREYPRASRAAPDEFLYWSKDAYGGKPIVSITHLTIVRGRGAGEPEVMVVGRQVFATHYTDAGWSITALAQGDTTRYLVYINQSAIDLLDSWYGGLIRRTVERRLRSEAVEVLQGLRRRLESGDPPLRGQAQVRRWMVGRVQAAVTRRQGGNHACGSSGDVDGCDSGNRRLGTGSGAAPADAAEGDGRS
ncbi:MAG: hypothetical protein AB7H96_16625 [Vicinamibacterales bacterium]